MYVGKDSLFSKWCWENWISTGRRLKLDHCLSPYMKVSSKWIRDLDVRPKTLSLLRVNTGEALETIGTGRDALSSVPITQEIIARINKWNYIKLKFLSIHQNN